MSLFLVFIGFFSNEAHATCTPVGTTTSTYTYSAATINSDATITFTGTISCNENGSAIKTSPYMCMKTSFSGATSANSSTTLPYTVKATVGGAGSSSTNQVSDIWYGPVSTVATNNVFNYSATVTVPARSSSLIAYPTGTYIGTVQLYWDMQQSSATVCEGSSGGGWDAGNVTLTANYIVPTLCQLNSTSNVDFGNISDIGTTTKNYTAQGAISTTCNSGTPYTIYLGNGNNYSNSYRRMVNSNSEYIPYQLYKDSSYSTLWNTTGGTTVVGGSGGVSLTGTGSAQSSVVYGKISSGTSIASRPGSYTDSVVVTVTY